MRVAGRLLLHAGWWAFIIYVAFWVTDLFYGTTCHGSSWVRLPGTVSLNKIDGKLGFYLFMMWPIVFAVGSQLYSYYRREWPWLPASVLLSWRGKRKRVQLAIFFTVAIAMMAAFEARIGPFRSTGPGHDKTVEVSCEQ